MSRPTTSMPRSIAWLERYLEEYPSTVVAVTHDRYFLDNVAEWILELDRGHGIPWQGQLFLLARAEGAAAGSSRSASAKRCARRSSASSNGCDRTPRPARPRARPASQRYEELRLARIPGAQRDQRDLHPARASASVSCVIEVKSLRKGYGERLLIDALSLQAAARRHRRHHRPQRRRQDDVVQDVDRRRAAGCR